MTDIIDQLAAAVAERVAPSIPIQVALWDSKDCAAYLRCSVSHFMQRIAPLPGFPQAIRLPTSGRTMHPRWEAQEVIDWIKNFKDKRVA